MKRLVLALSVFMLLGLRPIETIDNGKVGIASYYANMFEGRLTATGDVFRQKGFTAASNFFPLQTVVKVTNLETCDTIIVRINDRMHPRMAAKGRVIDMTTAGADSLKFRQKGLQRVSVIILDSVYDKNKFGSFKKSI